MVHKRYMDDVHQNYKDKDNFSKSGSNFYGLRIFRPPPKGTLKVLQTSHYRLKIYVLLKYKP